MAADFTISQPGGAGSAALNTDLEDARVGVEIQFASLAAEGNVFTLLDKPDASSASLGSSTSQVATLTADAPGEYAVTLTQGGASRTRVVEVNRDADGNLLGYGIVAPARGRNSTGSVTGRGPARTLERFRNAVLVGIAAAIAAGSGSDLDPAGPLAIGTVNATSVAIGRSAAPLTLDGSTIGVSAAGALSLAGRGVTLVGLAPASDVAPTVVGIAGGDAWSSAVTNLVGGKLQLRGGSGKASGTDKYGDVEVSLGRLDSGSASAKFSLKYTTGAGDLFATELASFAKRTGGDGPELAFTGSTLISSTSSLLVQGTAATFGSPSTAQGGAISFSFISGTTLTGHTAPGDAAVANVEVRGGAAYGSAVTNTTGGKLRLRGGAGSTGGTHKHGDVLISAGRTVADGSTAKVAITYGTSTDPFASQLLAFSRGTGGEALLDATSTVGIRTTTGNLEFATVDAAGLFVVRTGSTTAGRVLTLGQVSGNRARWLFYSGPADAQRATLDVGAGSLAWTMAAGINFEVYTAAGGAITFSSAGTMTATAAGTATWIGDTSILRGSTSTKVQAPTCTIGTTSNDHHVITPTLDTRLWVNTGFAGRRERRYFHGLVSASGDTALTGTFTPTITDGVLRIETRAMYSTASGGQGYSIRTVATFRIAAGVITQIAAVSLESEHEDGATAAAQNLLSGGTMRVVVNQPDATSRRWEAQMDVYYCAAA